MSRFKTFPPRTDTLTANVRQPALMRREVRWRRNRNRFVSPSKRMRSPIFVNGARTRVPDDPPGEAWAYGTDLGARKRED